MNIFSFKTIQSQPIDPPTPLGDKNEVSSEEVTPEKPDEQEFVPEKENESGSESAEIAEGPDDDLKKKDKLKKVKFK